MSVSAPEAIETELSLARPDRAILLLLLARDGFETTIALADGRRVVATSIAYGWDEGDVFAHVTAENGTADEADFFYTSDVRMVLDRSGHSLLVVEKVGLENMEVRFP